MKNKIIKQYTTRLLIYSAIYVLCAVLIDQWLNGWLVQWLYDHLPFSLFLALNENRLVFLCLPYAVGLAILSVFTVLRLNRLFNTASEGLREDSPLLQNERCPEELREFRQAVQEFHTARRESEQARQLAEQQKNDLIVYLAHDLKTPLTSVIGYLSLLEDTQELPMEQRAKYVGIALSKAYRLEQLINEFFEITRMNLQTIETQKSHINLTVLLLQILEEFFPMAQQKGLTVIHDIPPDLTLIADSDKLARVFDNLFRNAVSYSHPHTELRCVARRRDNHLTVAIRNQGDDIPKNKLDRLFDKFYRADGARRTATGGAGLGLAFAKQIVELHGGTIRASCIDGLTEFEVTLPL